MVVTVSRERGLQPERTVLSWWRTALAVSAGAAVVLRFTAGESSGTSVAAVLIAAAPVTLFAAGLRGRQLRRRPPTAPPAWLVLGLAGAAAAAGLGALLLLVR